MFPALDRLVQSLTGLPGIGERSALRIAFHILKSDETHAEQLSEAIHNLRKSIRFCPECGGLTDRDGVCKTCADPARDRRALCVVEDPGDVFAIEKTGEFHGLYHVLGGALSPLDGIGPEDLRLTELFERVNGPADTAPIEIFLATNPTLEGDATAHYIHERLRRPGLRVTRISHGIPTGATIEYADRSTLARSIRSRQEIL